MFLLLLNLCLLKQLLLCLLQMHRRATIISLDLHQWILSSYGHWKGIAWGSLLSLLTKGLNASMSSIQYNVPSGVLALLSLNRLKNQSKIKEDLIREKISLDFHTLEKQASLISTLLPDRSQTALKFSTDCSWRQSYISSFEGSNVGAIIASRTKQQGGMVALGSIETPYSS